MPKETEITRTPREDIDYVKEVCRETDEMANNLDGVSADDVYTQQMKAMNAGLKIFATMSQTKHPLTEEERKELEALRYKTSESCDNLLAAYCKKHGITDADITTLPEVEQKMRNTPGGTA